MKEVTISLVLKDSADLSAQFLAMTEFLVKNAALVMDDHALEAFKRTLEKEKDHMLGYFLSAVENSLERRAAALEIDRQERLPLVSP